MKTSAQIVTETRTKLGISQAAFAEKFGLTDKSIISRYESGKFEPPLDLVIECLKYLGLDVKEWLKDRTNEETPGGL